MCATMVWKLRKRKIAILLTPLFYSITQVPGFIVEI
jgi:hypothetical protein